MFFTSSSERAMIQQEVSSMGEIMIHMGDQICKKHEINNIHDMESTWQMAVELFLVVRDTEQRSDSVVVCQSGGGIELPVSQGHEHARTCSGGSSGRSESVTVTVQASERQARRPAPTHTYARTDEP